MNAGRFRALVAAFASAMLLVAGGVPASAQPFEPYAKGSAANAMYDLLFCDDPSAFQPQPTDKPADWQALLFGVAPDPAMVAALAQNNLAESRVRALAFNWLRADGRATPKGVVLGVIIEVPLDGGLDVLAAYADGRVRYINHTGKLAVIEPGGAPDVSLQAKRVIELARPVVERIGPWDKPRLPPPAKPSIRLTFIVSDGLYFGQGPFQVMQQDALAGPLLQQESRLLVLVVDKTVAEQAPSSAMAGRAHR